jgi:hypothetical protein
MTMNLPTTMIQNLNALTLEDVRRQAPAAFGYMAAHLTPRYELVQTGELIERLMDRGYVVTSAKQDQPRHRDPLTVRHMVTLVHEHALANRTVTKEGVPTLLLWNSNNGKTTLRAACGFYRFICSNGLIVGVTEEEFAFRHSVSPLRQLPDALDLIAERQELTLQRMQDWQQIELADRKVLSFAERAAQLRFGERSGQGFTRDQILHARREEDAGNSLWRVMNRVQENLMHGGIEGRSATGRKVTSRPIKNITVDLTFNRGLWQLAEEFAEAA